MRNVLVTNDDGVDAPGLRVMLEVALLIGGRIVVAAPDRDWSGCGSATGDRSRLGPVEPLGASDGGDWYRVAGTPCVAVQLAFAGAFGPVPDLVLSGVNDGANIGVATFHSGTVAAALTGAYLGARAMAISLDHGRWAKPALDRSSEQEWGGVVPVGERAVERLLAEPRRTVLNVNVPNVPPGQVRGLREARLAPAAKVAVATRDGRTSLVLEQAFSEAGDQYDTDALRAGFASVTRLPAYGHAPPP